MRYIGHLIIEISTVTRWVSISALAFLVGNPIEIMSSAIELKNCVITAEI